MEPDRELKYRIDQAFFAINQDVRPDQREDLRRIWRHARELWSLMDIELVNCRRRNKPTPKYQELEAECRETITTLEQYITWAHLSG